MQKTKEKWLMTKNDVGLTYQCVSLAGRTEGEV